MGRKKSKRSQFKGGDSLSRSESFSEYAFETKTTFELLGKEQDPILKQIEVLKAVGKEKMEEIQVKMRPTIEEWHDIVGPKIEVCHEMTRPFVECAAENFSIITGQKKPKYVEWKYQPSKLQKGGVGARKSKQVSRKTISGRETSKLRWQRLMGDHHEKTLLDLTRGAESRPAHSVSGSASHDQASVAKVRSLRPTLRSTIAAWNQNLQKLQNGNRDPPTDPPTDPPAYGSDRVFLIPMGEETSSLALEESSSSFGGSTALPSGNRPISPIVLYFDSRNSLESVGSTSDDDCSVPVAGLEDLLSDPSGCLDAAQTTDTERSAPVPIDLTSHEKRFDGYESNEVSVFTRPEEVLSDTSGELNAERNTATEGCVPVPIDLTSYEEICDGYDSTELFSVHTHQSVLSEVRQPANGWPSLRIRPYHETVFGARTSVHASDETREDVPSFDDSSYPMEAVGHPTFQPPRVERLYPEQRYETIDNIKYAHLENMSHTASEANGYASNGDTSIDFSATSRSARPNSHSSSYRHNEDFTTDSRAHGAATDGLTAYSHSACGGYTSNGECSTMYGSDSNHNAPTPTPTPAPTWQNTSRVDHAKTGYPPSGQSSLLRKSTGGIRPRQHPPTTRLPPRFRSSPNQYSGGTFAIE